MLDRTRLQTAPIRAVPSQPQQQVARRAPGRAREKSRAGLWGVSPQTPPCPQGDMIALQLQRDIIARLPHSKMARLTASAAIEYNTLNSTCLTDIPEKV